MFNSILERNTGAKQLFIIAGGGEGITGGKEDQTGPFMGLKGLGKVQIFKKLKL